MLGLVASFSDKWLAFLWEQTVPHYWLTCFSIPMKMSFQIGKRKLARKFNLSYCYIDDLISFNNKRFNPTSPGRFNTFSTWGGGADSEPPYVTLVSLIQIKPNLV